MYCKILLFICDEELWGCCLCLCLKPAKPQFFLFYKVFQKKKRKFLICNKEYLVLIYDIIMVESIEREGNELMNQEFCN